MPDPGEIPLTAGLVTTVLGYVWSPFATALHVLLWYNLRQDHESLTARMLASELGVASRR